ncbi:MAG: hypothetical protein IBX40_03765 [Methanosarcinales archaeon]|nr:hypothetical protein [Methanosarcinales archaeon]
MGSEKEEYLKKRYSEMSPAQLELIIKQINLELEHHPEADKTELHIAVEALEEKKKAAQNEKMDRSYLPDNMEYGIDVGEEFR